MEEFSPAASALSISLMVWSGDESPACGFGAACAAARWQSVAGGGIRSSARARFFNLARGRSSTTRLRISRQGEKPVLPQPQTTNQVAPAAAAGSTLEDEVQEHNAPAWDLPVSPSVFYSLRRYCCLTNCDCEASSSGLFFFSSHFFEVRCLQLQDSDRLQ